MSEVDIIVPTIDGREESLKRLEDSLARTTSVEYETIILKDSPTCGAGWREGLKRSEAPYVLLACDDQEFLNPGWDISARMVVNDGLIPCPRVWEPNGMIQSQGGDMGAFRHIISRPQKDRTPVDYTTIPFLSREMADAIGMLDDLHYCSDVWTSYRGRQLGYETVLCHGYEVRHWREDHGRGAGMSEHDRDTQDEQRMREELARHEAAR